ncbi:hypothetical protein HQ520_03395 [bacterium]|nr:hypothetical protein [bacterium]
MRASPHIPALRRRWGLLVVIMAGLLLKSAGQGAPVAPGACESTTPSLVLETDTVDFGLYQPGPDYRFQREIRLINRGEKPLRVFEVHAGCQTNATCRSKRILPGQETVLFVELLAPKTYTLSPSLERQIILHTSDEARPRQTISLSARFGYSLEWRPKHLVLHTDSPPATIRISDLLTSAPISFTHCRSRDGRLEVVPAPLKQMDREGGNRLPKPIADFQVGFTQSPAAPLPGHDLIEIFTTRKDIPKIAIPVEIRAPHSDDTN